jgi:hypothetical protein
MLNGAKFSTKAAYDTLQDQQQDQDFWLAFPPQPPKHKTQPAPQDDH